jgi:zinc-ribbon domain
MSQCPNCHAENAPDARFCADCGVRLDQQPPPGPRNPEEGAPQNQPTVPGAPAGKTGKETIVLRAPDLAPPARLPGQPPPAAPFTDATIVTGLPVSAAPPATDKTILAGPPAAADGGTLPAGRSSAPTSAFPAPPHGPTPAAPTLPPGALPPGGPAARSGGRMWLVIALVSLLGLGMIGALVGGVLLFMRTTSSITGTPTPDVGGGLAQLPTARARPTAAPKPTARPRPTTAPKPTAAPSPNAGSSGSGNVLIEDDFDNPKSSKLTEEKTDTATYSFVDGAYAISVKTPKYIVWSSYSGSYGDIDAAVDTTFDDGPVESAAGLIFRYQDEDNFYYYRISADGSYNLTLYKAGERQVLVDWTEAPELKGRGQANHMRVEAVDDRIRLFVNDALLAEVSDDTFAKGEIALAVTTFEKGGATFKFDNLVVRGR